MEAVLLIDFGSTYTKVTAADTQNARLLGCASSHTTVETDVGEGLAAAVRELEAVTGKIEYGRRFACSSASGGLKMVVCGLVPELTAKAAKLASLGAGAKVAKVFSFQLTDDDIEEIDAISPDILLLTGGTDGGNTKCILHNAAMLGSKTAAYPVVAAGNRSCAKEVMDLLKGCRAYSCENVMPSLGRLNIDPVRGKIREIFLERIVRAKGLSRESRLLDGIMMPTPAAVLAAVQLLSQGHGEDRGIGDLMAVDLGGATTDVYSVAAGMPRDANTVYRGLPEPFAMRTVEGDIGMRYSAAGVLEAAGIGEIAKAACLPEEKAGEMIISLGRNPEALPENEDQKSLDFALASLAVLTATLRHAGTIEEAYTAAGLTYVQSGKDLRDTANLVMTGGALIHAERQEEIAGYAMHSGRYPHSLRPQKAKLFIDSDYILSAMGLLASHAPQAALGIMRRALKQTGSKSEEV
jgi:uncharacterized protein (TIGR01319 family)